MVDLFVREFKRKSLVENADLGNSTEIVKKGTFLPTSKDYFLKELMFKFFKATYLSFTS